MNRKIKIKTTPNSVYNTSQQTRASNKPQNLYSFTQALSISKIKNRKIQTAKSSLMHDHSHQIDHAGYRQKKEYENKGRNSVNLSDKIKSNQYKGDKQNLHFSVNTSKNGGFRFDRKISIKYYNQSLNIANKNQNKILVLGKSLALSPSALPVNKNRDEKKNSSLYDKKFIMSSSIVFHRKQTPKKQKFNSIAKDDEQNVKLFIKSVEIQYDNNNRYGAQHYVLNDKRQVQLENQHLNSVLKLTKNGHLAHNFKRIKPYYSQNSLHLPTSFFLTSANLLNK